MSWRSTRAAHALHDETMKAMTTNLSFEELNKDCERSITKMSDAEALVHIGRLIDDAFDASFERGAKRALYLLDELSKRKLVDSDGALVEYFRANAWAARSHIANVRDFGVEPLPSARSTCCPHAPAQQST